MFKCSLCNYVSNRHFNLIRHQYNKHSRVILENKIINNNEKNVNQNEKNVNQNEKNVNQNEKNVNQKINICIKCNKSYKIKKSLIEHEKNCKGIDDLTCPRCMVSFSSRQAKYLHLKRNNCEPRSIIYARKPNQHNIDTQQNITTQNITTQNNIENQTNNYITNNNNICINNYKNERLDYVTYDKMLIMFKKFYNSPSLLTKEIHFNDQFPENNNIQFENKTRALVKVNDELVLKDLNTLAEELAKEKGDKVKQFAEDNEIEICKDMEKAKYKEILDLIFTYIILKEPKEEYRLQVKSIKDMIVTSKIKLSKYGCLI